MAKPRVDLLNRVIEDTKPITLAELRHAKKRILEALVLARRDQRIPMVDFMTKRLAVVEQMIESERARRSRG